MAKRKGESIFLSYMKNSIKAVNGDAFWHKITDTPVFKDDKNNKMRFTRAKPFDAIAGLPGFAMAIEAKFWDDIRPWAMSKVSDNQIENLLSAQANGYAAFIAIHIKVPRQIDDYRIMSINQFMQFKTHGSKKSISYFTFQSEVLPIDKVGRLGKMYLKLDQELFNRVLGHGTVEQSKLF